ncbi:MAG: AAA family ATPase [Pirellulales bacterium]|nr:AAA family ATPase [Pirellulales bacterium]
MEQALEAVPELAAITHYHDELRDVVEAARAYQPQMVLTELGEDLRDIGILAEEVAACSPGSSLVAVFSADRFPAGASESAVMIQALRLGVEDFIRRPVSSRDLEQLLARRLTPRLASATSFGKVISFVSNKGGVGKSTAAVNVAVELGRRHPGRVLLVDASLQVGVCAAQLNLQPRATLVDAWQQRDRLDELLLRELTTAHESGLHLLAAPGSAVESAELDDAIVSRILMLARRSYDYVIVDTFPLFDRVVMAILDLSDRAYVMVENVVPTMETVRSFFGLLEDVEFQTGRQKLVLNRYSRAAGGPSEHEVESYLGRDVDHVIPFDKKVILAANTGQPLVLSGGRFRKTVRSFRRLTDEIESINGRSEPASLGPASLGSAGMGSANVGPANVGPAGMRLDEMGAGAMGRDSAPAPRQSQSPDQQETLR